MSATNTNGVTIVTTGEERKKFIDFPYKLYKGDEYWVPPLRMDQKKLLDVNKNAFYNNAEIALFLAEKNGKPSGRIAAIIDRRFNEYHGNTTGNFGFFECIDDQNCANLLFKVAGDWLKERGMTEILGPSNPSMLDTPGILTEGFDKIPYIMMPYNKPYYDKLVTNAGFEKAMGLLAYVVNDKIVSHDRINRASEIVRKRNPGLTMRKFNKKEMRAEAERIRLVFNEAWKDNWGFIPISKEEFEQTADDLKLVVEPDLANIVEVDGEIIAFSIALPDYNLCFKNMNGRLLPFGIFKFLIGRKKINRIRTVLMGVHPDYRGKGIDALLHQKSIIHGPEMGMGTSEMSWILESNHDMIRVAERMGGYLDKEYKMYSKPL